MWRRLAEEEHTFQMAVCLHKRFVNIYLNCVHHINTERDKKEKMELPYQLATLECVNDVRLMRNQCVLAHSIIKTGSFQRRESN